MRLVVELLRQTYRSQHQQKYLFNTLLWQVAEVGRITVEAAVRVDIEMQLREK
jgi:hypothetical protein